MRNRDDKALEQRTAEQQPVSSHYDAWREQLLRDREEDADDPALD